MKKAIITTFLLAILTLLGGCSSDDPTEPTDDGGGGGDPGVGVAYEIPPFEIVRHALNLADVWSNGELAICVGDGRAVFILSDEGRFLLPVPDDFNFSFRAVSSTGEGTTFVSGLYGAAYNPDSPPIFRFENGLVYTETIDSQENGSSVFCTSTLNTYLTSGRNLWRRLNDTWEIEHEFDFSCKDVYPAGSSILFVATINAAYRFDSQNWEEVYSSSDITVKSVEGIDEDQVLAIDTDMILKFDGGTEFEAVYSAGVNLSDVNWASEDWAVAVGEEGTVVMYDGINWSRLQVDFPSFLTGVAAWKDGGQSGALAVGYNGAEYTYADGSWTGSYLPDGIWQDIAGDSQGNLFGLYTSDDDGTIFMQYDGATWEQDIYPGNMILDDLFCLNANALWALGQQDIDSFVAHYNGSAWSSSWLSSLNTPRDIWVSDTPEVYVACDFGTVYVNSAPETASQPDQHLNGIWGFSPNDVFVVGENGTISRRLESGLWELMTSGTTQNLNAIHGSSSSHLVAVGDNGTVLRFNGTSWAAMDSGLDVDLDEVWTDSAQNIWVASSAANRLAYYDGSAWEYFDTSWLGAAHKSVWSDGQDVWASGGSVLLRYAEPPSFAALLGTP